MSVLLGMAIGEVALRAMKFNAPIWYQPDGELGWTLRPGAKGVFNKEGNAHIWINPAGYRDRSHTIEKPASIYRIAVLGDSYAEAMQVEYKDTFWWQLGERLEACRFAGGRQVEVLNFGVSGYGTAQELIALESQASRYKPDLVLLAFTNGNDVVNNSRQLEAEKDRPFFRLEGGRLKLDASFAASDDFRQRSSPWLVTFRDASDRLRLLQLVHAAKNNLAALRSGIAHASAMPGAEAGIDLSVFAPPRKAAWEEAWSITDGLIGRMNRYAGEHGAKFALVSVTHSLQVNPDPDVRRNAQNALGVQDLFYVERHLEALGKREGFRVIPLAYEMQRRAEAEKVYFHGFRNVGLGVGHWNPDGHRVAAELIARSLCAGDS